MPFLSKKLLDELTTGLSIAELRKVAQTSCEDDGACEKGLYTENDLKQVGKDSKTTGKPEEEEETVEETTGGSSPLIDSRGVKQILDAIQSILAITGPAIGTEVGNVEETKFPEEMKGIAPEFPKDLLKGPLTPGNSKELIEDISGLGDGDFDGDDEVVKDFKNNHGGIKTVIKIITNKNPEEATEEIKSIASSLDKTRTAWKQKLSRYAFKGFVELKNEGQTDKNLLDAVKKLAKLASSKEEYNSLIQVAYAITNPKNGGDYDAAAVRLREIFSSSMPQKQNLRVAYTTLRTQEGEPYQLCPKGLSNGYGYAPPMPISSCRENCIDSRITKDGKVTCAFRDWLHVVADNQQAANARLEVHKNPDPDISYINIPEGDRSAAIPASVSKVLINTENRLENARKKMPNVPEKNFETRLDDASESHLGHHGEPKDIDGNGIFSRQAAKRRIISKIFQDKIDYDSDDTLGTQIEKGNNPTADETTEKRLDSLHTFDGEDSTEMLDQILGKGRKKAEDYKVKITVK